MSHNPEQQDPNWQDPQNREHRASSRREENAIWSIFGYLLSGLLFWGGVGWAADRFFNTSFLTPDRPLGRYGWSALPSLDALRPRVTSCFGRDTPKAAKGRKWGALALSKSKRPVLTFPAACRYLSPLRFLGALVA